MHEDDDETLTPAAPTQAGTPSITSVRRADQIIRVLLGLVAFVVVVGTVGNLWDRGVRVDVALVAALLSALATYAIAGKFKDKQ